MEKKFDDYEKSVQFMSDSFEEQKNKFESILEVVKQLRKENEELKERLDVVETKLDSIEVKEKEKNLLVVGVPKQRELDTGKTVIQILEAMNLQLSNNDIEESFRLKQDDGPILVKFNNIHSKKEVLRKIKQLKGITTRKCGLDNNDRKIYFNEDLPINIRLLFKRAREVKKSKGYRAAYCSNGVVYLKKKMILTQPPK